ncbi:hypothetical protein FACS189440_04800 [Bacteroidia bacterium]|nr:hypothetical protein FACS189440_04800 [Bacteroidia bacterium]
MIEESLQQYMKALSIYEKIGNKKSSMLVLSAIAGIHRMLNDYDRAIYYLEKSKVIAEELNDFNVLSRTYYELGAINMGNGAYDKALEQVLKAIEISHSNNWIIIETYAMYAAANVYIDGFQDFDQAEEYVKQALLMTEKYDIPAIVLELQLTLAKIHLGQKRYKDCDELASMVYEMDTVNIERRMNASLLIIDANIFLGNQAKASSFLNNYKNLVNQFNKDGLHQSLSEMEVKYKTEKKDLRVADMEKEKVLGIVGGGLLLSLLILFIILHRLAVAKSKMCEQQVIQVEQEKQIVATQAALDGETAERTRMARDLHDGLGGLLSVVKLNLDDVEHLQNARDTLDKSIEELRRVAHHMMPESLLRYGLKAALEDFCLSAPNVQFDYFGDDSPIDDRTAILIYRCTYELVNNAIKYANATTIQVQLYQDTDRISLIVEDNGCGFDTETVETPKSDVSTGMGLGNLRARVAAGKGIMDISSSPGKGTEVHVKLPLS